MQAMLRDTQAEITKIVADSCLRRDQEREDTIETTLLVFYNHQTRQGQQELNNGC